MSAILWLAVALAAPVIGDGIAVAQEQRPLIVPMHVSSGDDYVEVTLMSSTNKPVVANFIVDTGTQNIVFDEALVAKLGYKITVGGSGSGQYKTIVAPNIYIGDTFIKGGTTDYQVAPLPHDPRIVGHLDGILGMQILPHFAVMLDYSRNRLILLPQQLSIADVHDLGFVAPYDKPIPLSKSSADHQSLPYFDVLLDGMPVHAQIDTGSSGTIFPDSVIKDKSSPAAPMATVVSVGSSMSMTSRQISSLTFGTSKFTAPIVLVAHALQFAATIGQDILAQNQILYDFPNWQFYIRQDERLNQTLCATMEMAVHGVFRIQPNVDGDWHIIEIKSATVLPGARVGDELTKVAGRKVNGLRQAAFEALFAKRPVAIQLTRDGKSFDEVIH